MEDNQDTPKEGQQTLTTPTNPIIPSSPIVERVSGSALSDPSVPKPPKEPPKRTIIPPQLFSKAAQNEKQAKEKEEDEEESAYSSSSFSIDNKNESTIAELDKSSHLSIEDVYYFARTLAVVCDNNARELTALNKRIQSLKSESTEKTDFDAAVSRRTELRQLENDKLILLTRIQNVEKSCDALEALTSYLKGKTIQLRKERRIYPQEDISELYKSIKKRVNRSDRYRAFFRSFKYKKLFAFLIPAVLGGLLAVVIMLNIISNNKFKDLTNQLLYRNESTDVSQGTLPKDVEEITPLPKPLNTIAVVITEDYSEAKASGSSAASPAQPLVEVQAADSTAPSVPGETGFDLNSIKLDGENGEILVRVTNLGDPKTEQKENSEGLPETLDGSEVAKVETDGTSFSTYKHSISILGGWSTNLFTNPDPDGVKINNPSGLAQYLYHPNSWFQVGVRVGYQCGIIDSMENNIDEIDVLFALGGQSRTTSETPVNVALTPLVGASYILNTQSFNVKAGLSLSMNIRMSNHMWLTIEGIPEYTFSPEKKLPEGVTHIITMGAKAGFTLTI